ncbi:MAG: endonuclease III domain-containing protein [Kiritimatiellae bacterium]|nr:endonuclease III domain-containing protein [Kiritimatiellia bacterium]MDW8458284.1 endonuclease III domain-containing protein [Verrucomicrobiota bacterium]
MQQSPTPRRGAPLMEVFDALLRHFGPQRWWPARTKFEMMVGAILTQNTAWSNVEKAIARLRAAGALDPKRLHEAPLERVAEWIRPAGYFNVKARRLRAFTTWLVDRYDGSVRRMLREPPDRLRAELLGVKGIGPETADSILLYAAGHPIFVVDAYTRRFLSRHGWLPQKASYEQTAALFEANLPKDPALYNEYHALIVALGKTFCRARPRCADCPLRRWLPGPSFEETAERSIHRLAR